jgi:hypothetical protein
MQFHTHLCVLLLSKARCERLNHAALIQVAGPSGAAASSVKACFAIWLGLLQLPNYSGCRATLEQLSELGGVLKREAVLYNYANLLCQCW